MSRLQFSMPRPQFSVKTMLWLVLLVAGFFAGMALQKQLDEPLAIEGWNGATTRLNR